jgi:hypothetical protein
LQDAESKAPQKGGMKPPHRAASGSRFLPTEHRLWQKTVLSSGKGNVRFDSLAIVRGESKPAFESGLGRARRRFFFDKTTLKSSKNP